MLKLLSETYIFSVVFVMNCMWRKGYFFYFWKPGLADPTISLTWQDRDCKMETAASSTLVLDRIMFCTFRRFNAIFRSLWNTIRKFVSTTIHLVQAHSILIEIIVAFQHSAACWGANFCVFISEFLSHFPWSEKTWNFMVHVVELD